MIKLKGQLINHIQQLPLPQKVVQHINDIYINSLQSFLKDTIAPSERLLGLLQTQFFQQIYKYYIEMGLKEGETLDDVCDFLQCKKEKYPYMTKWNAYEDTMRTRDNKIQRKFAKRLYHIISDKNAQEVKLKHYFQIQRCLALICLVRYFHPKARKLLQTPQNVWTFLFDNKLPSKKTSQEFYYEIQNLQNYKGFPIEVIRQKIPILNSYSVTICDGSENVSEPQQKKQIVTEDMQQQKQINMQGKAQNNFNFNNNKSMDSKEQLQSGEIIICSEEEK